MRQFDFPSVFCLEQLWNEMEQAEQSVDISCFMAHTGIFYTAVQSAEWDGLSCPCIVQMGCPR